MCIFVSCCRTRYLSYTGELGTPGKLSESRRQLVLAVALGRFECLNAGLPVEGAGGGRVGAVDRAAGRTRVAPETGQDPDRAAERGGPGSGLPGPHPSAGARPDRPRAARGP